jgi:hypothetical protein
MVYNPPAVKGASQTCASSQVRLTPSSSLSTVRGSLPRQSVNTSYHFILYYITLYYTIHYLHITFISGRWQLVHGEGAAAASKCNHFIAYHITLLYCVILYHIISYHIIYCQQITGRWQLLHGAGVAAAQECGSLCSLSYNLYTLSHIIRYIPLYAHRSI